MENWLNRFLMGIVLLFGTISAFANSWIDSFQKANSAYQQGQIDSAILGYQGILQHGQLESDELYYNLGNAYYKTQALGKAVWAYEKALLLNPSNEDAVFNLELINGQLQDEILPQPEIFIKRLQVKLSSFISPKKWTWMSILFVWILCSALALAFFTKYKKQKRLGILVSSISLILVIFSFGISWFTHKTLHNHKAAIVVATSAELMSEPNQEATTLLTVHEGLKVETVSTKTDPEWQKVKLPNGKVGWLLFKDLWKL